MQTLINSNNKNGHLLNECRNKMYMIILWNTCYNICISAAFIACQ